MTEAAAGTSVAMGSAVTSPMSDLPEECIVKILSLLPFDSLIRCMRVDKTWESAARYVIKTRKYLSVRRMAQCVTCRKKNIACQSCRKKRCEDGVIGIDGAFDLNPMLSLMKMQNIQKLEVNGLACDANWIALFILRDTVRQRLRVMTGFWRIPVSPPYLFQNLVKLDCCVFDEKTATACPNLIDLTIRDRVHGSVYVGAPVNLPLPAVTMSKLKRLVVKETRRPTTDFVTRHASQLTLLHSNGPLPERHNSRPLIFPELRELQVTNCSRVGASFKNCPKLESLNVADMSHLVSLSDLPVESMTDLQVIWMTAVPEPIQTLSHIVSSFKRLVNLKVLGLSMSARNISFFSEDGNLISTLFDDHQKLEQVYLRLVDSPVPVMDLAVDRLIRRNPDLTKLCLTGMRISDPVIEAMSELRRLQELEISGLSLTTAGVLKLLTGPSARSLTRLQVTGGHKVNKDQVEQQFEVMISGRGLRRHEKDWWKKPSSNDFCFSANVV